MIHACTYTGAGSKLTIAAILIASGNYTADQVNKIRPNWLQVVNEGSGSARIGDVNTSSTYGLLLYATAGQMMPPIARLSDTYSFTSTYIYAANGTVVSLLFDA